MEPRTQDAALVLRLWVEPHDHQVRGRLQSLDADDSVAAAGVDDIVDAVRAEILAFQDRAASDGGGLGRRDGHATDDERPR